MGTFWLRDTHRVIADALARMDAELLARCKCYFGGGTAIVLQNGEYRTSVDVDFMCADTAGYRELRSLVVSRGAAGLFGQGISSIREFRADQYGIRGWIQHFGQGIKVEIVRESRIQLSGEIDGTLGVPVLCVVDQFCEKLFANSDRGTDNATAHRDAIDLGMLVRTHGEIPVEALAKAEDAYGPDIRAKLAAVLRLLENRATVEMIADEMNMTLDDVVAARDHLAAAASRFA